jgi:hypothetical protein
LKLSYDQAWADVVAMMRSHADILLIVAGVFLFLPNFALALLAPQPVVDGALANLIAVYSEYFREHGALILLLNIPVWLGGAVLLALLLDPQAPTVGQALKTTLVMLPSIIVLNWMTNFALVGGFFAFIIPGLYLIGRIMLASPAQMAGRLLNPFTALQSSLNLSRGNGWRITGLFLIFGLVLIVGQAAIGAVIGIILKLILPKTAFAVATGMLGAFLSALIALAIALLSAAIYRQLAGVSRGI